jgi:LL-diaminopimelate aminotransferase
MNIQTATRLEGIGEYYFSTKLREIDELNRQGKQIINLGIGSPDQPPHPEVVRTLEEAARRPDTHAYQSYKGAPALRQAVADWYITWYGVELDPDNEILPLIGSKEGIMHICMTYLNAGDKALIPNPGYPTYSAAVRLAGGTPLPYVLREDKGWEPDWEAQRLFERLVDFGLRHNILICHDNPYSFILNKEPLSLLGVKGAKEVALELNSLSKSHNMAGWRVGILAGAKERISEVMRFKSNMDSGMFLPLQLAAAKALQLNREWYDSVNAVYARRREKVQALLKTLHCTYDPTQVGLFMWASIPAGYKDGYALSDAVLYEANVFITPGGIFGSEGNGYIRVSLCATEEKLEQAIARISAVGAFKPVV